MRVKVIARLCVCFCCASVFVITATLVSAQEMTVEELTAAYEKSFANLRSWDITYAAGHVSQWDGWKPKSDAGLQPRRWRKSGSIERKDRVAHVGDVPILRNNNNRRDPQEPAVLRGVPIPQYAEYTDGSKLWRFRGDPSRTEFAGLLDEGRGTGEIRPIAHLPNAVLGSFPYGSFYFAQSIGKNTYSIAQILKGFRTEIIDIKNSGNGLVITTRSYLTDSKEDPRYFVQMSFDSSVGYNLKQIVCPLKAVLGGATGGSLDKSFSYTVRDFVEYHSSGDGAFFPVKIVASLTDDIDKLENLGTIGKTSALSIILNQPVDVPAIEFPPGAIVVIEEDEKYTSYIWDEGNKPLKVLTDEDYEAAARAGPGLPPREGISTIRIVFIVIGIIMIVVALVLMALWRENKK